MSRNTRNSLSLESVNDRVHAVYGTEVGKGSGRGRLLTDLERLSIPVLSLLRHRALLEDYSDDQLRNVLTRNHIRIAAAVPRPLTQEVCAPHAIPLL
jgi:hypothetical protein